MLLLYEKANDKVPKNTMEKFSEKQDHCIVFIEKAYDKAP